MYLPSKLKFKYLVVCLAIIILLFLPFANAVQNIFVFFLRQLTVTPRQSIQLNEKLKKQNTLLRLQVKEAARFKGENQTLRQALGFKTESGLDLTGAGIIGFSPSSWRRYLLIDAGKDREIEKGLLAINERGELLGKITEVEDNFSRLLLVNDPDFNLLVFVGEAACGFLKGYLSGAKILYVEKEKEIKKGDRVWIRAGSSSFPIEVGLVQQVKKNSNQLFCDIEAKITSESAFLDKIFIIK